MRDGDGDGDGDSDGYCDDATNEPCVTSHRDFA